MRLVLGVFLTFFAYHAWSQCTKGNCQNGEGVYRFQNGSLYSGQFRLGKPHGKGTLQSANGNKYEGTWHSNLQHGQGRLVFASGEEYAGEFVNSKFQGFGIYRFIDGRQYEGQWRDGKPNGLGTLTGADQRTQTGIWKDGRLAEAEQAPVSHAEANRPTHRPVSLPNCNLEPCADGLGFFTYPDGSRYEGVFVAGVPGGHGICLYANGDRYEGSWSMHKPNGKGKMTYARGDVVDGTWYNGSLVQGSKLLHDQKPVAGKGKIYALLVGVSRYEKFESLKYTDDDAYRMYAFLKSPEGGAVPDDQIVILIDESAVKANIMKALADFAMRARPEDALFCFFSGHGLNGSFLPIDSDGYRNVVSYQEVKDQLARCRAKQKLFVADACHSGSLLSARTSVSQSVDLLYSRLNESSGGTAFLLSSKKEEYSLESKGLRQGVFSHFLIEGLKGAADHDGDRVVTVAELYQFVHQRVRQYTKMAQTPVLAGTFDRRMPVGVIRATN